jgi:hypothetical protein
MSWVYSKKEKHVKGVENASPRRGKRCPQLSPLLPTGRRALHLDRPFSLVNHGIYTSLYLLPLLGILLLTGCSSPYLYEWGDYDEWLYENYKNPKDDEELYVDLTALITEYESRKNPAVKPMAPGLYAEYGFLLMRRGENNRAIEYYNKEKALWPESAVFMDSMIQVAKIADTSTAKKATGDTP